MVLVRTRVNAIIVNNFVAHDFVPVLTKSFSWTLFDFNQINTHNRHTCLTYRTYRNLEIPIYSVSISLASVSRFKYLRGPV